MNDTTPIRRQYLEIKAKHQNAILLFRLGDFYEAFDEDARLLARELDIVLTSKPMGKNLRVPLAGIPHHSLERHLGTLIARGHRVAICEQTSTTPVKGIDGKKLIRRDVVRIVTAGTVIEPALLDSRRNNFLAALTSDGHRSGLAFADITTGDFSAAEMENKEVLAELSRLAPTEILIAEQTEIFNSTDSSHFVTKINSAAFDYPTAKTNLLKHFGAVTLKPFGLENSPLAVSAANAVLTYLQDTQFAAAEQLTRLKAYNFSDFMSLDAKTFQSLEVFESNSGHSLLSVIDRTLTPMGARLLRRWLRQPLLNVAEIFQRQEYVEYFKNNRKIRDHLRDILIEVKDLERLSSRAKAICLTSNELRVLGKSLELITKIRAILQTDAKFFGRLLTHLPDCRLTAELISDSINDDLPSRAAEKIGTIKKGFSEELDKLRETLKNGRQYLTELERRERARTGIKSLRVGFNKVFGYYIEITKSNLHLVPKDYSRKQTLVPAERFVTLELKEYESLVLNAQERLAELESSIFRQICQQVGQKRAEILLAAQNLALLDTVCALAEVADEYNFQRPTVNETSLLRIKNGRHPVVEKILGEKGVEFIANSTELGGRGAPQIALITGPNASGKSTYLRQIAEIILLAQIGAFVPAEEALIGVCDRIFTRIGLYDRIGSGESTFMTEMIETAEILHNATDRSLILLDELGRGTSTFDGLAVARAVLEFIHNHPKLRSRTLFATHFHELADLEGILPNLKNMHFVIEEKDSELIFKYRLTAGTALKSYGVYASKLAGLPNPVVRRAEQLLKEFERFDSLKKPAPIEKQMTRAEQKLAEIDVDSLSPVEALMQIYELKKLLESEKRFPARRKAIG